MHRSAIELGVDEYDSIDAAANWPARGDFQLCCVSLFSCSLRSDAKGRTLRKEGFCVMFGTTKEAPPVVTRDVPLMRYWKARLRVSPWERSNWAVAAVCSSWSWAVTKLRSPLRRSSRSISVTDPSEISNSVVNPKNRLKIPSSFVVNVANT